MRRGDAVAGEMALPIAHATAGYLVQRLGRRRAPGVDWPLALAFMAIGNLPDVDFVVGFLLGRPGTFHRGISHTVVAAIVFGIVGGTLLRWWRGGRWWPVVLLCAAAYGSHLLVDAFTIDQRGPAGAQFFWPFSDAYYISPVTLFGEILIDGTSRQGFIWSIVAWPTVWVLAREALIAGLAVVLVEVMLREPAGTPVRGTRDEASLDPAELGSAGEEDLA